ncbi:hypothetical protein N7462_008690 [Penicillium macrosclerotiorum]|uniref:uncharacterized protein n=1 Tax=Penicillium macrosclerotiorum TaxID=303699 RepID=UPI002549787A|nr:uncharacterized protein N7462_008690 [Penicillium macrosclerotiorum]KAJ5675793.1 hypothetical protein N7462_008690 [Penicillium macrosclerotiorum]
MPPEDDQLPERKRAFKPKVRTGCITCKCVRSGRQCEGYELPKSLVILPRALAPAPTVESPLETRALELFFHKTAPQLAGYFEGPLFQGSVVQISLVEPAIRHAIAAVAMLHEEISASPATREGKSQASKLPIQLYNRSIRGIIDKVQAGPTAMPLIAMANILFICFEYFQGNVTMARSHVKSGIHLLHSWRERTHGSSTSMHPWGQRYDSFESQFMEMQIAPLLSVFRTNILDKDMAKAIKLVLNPVNEQGNVILGDHFSSPQQARVGLLDVITYASWRIQAVDEALLGKVEAKKEVMRIMQNMEQGLGQWESYFNDLVRRKGVSWGKKDRQAANVVRIIKLAGSFGGRSYLAGNECAWDSARAEYEEMLLIAEALIADRDRFPHDGFRPLSLDFGMLFSLHLLAWKCRWPGLRRRGLDLLQKIPRREWSLEVEHYHTIFSRIMEIEEAHLDTPRDEIVRLDMLPPEHARVHDFTVIAQPSSSRQPAIYAVSFWSKPLGLDGPSSSLTEYMQLGSSQAGESGVPASLITAAPSSLITQYYSYLRQLKG